MDIVEKMWISLSQGMISENISFRIPILNLDILTSGPIDLPPVITVTDAQFLAGRVEVMIR